MRQEIEDLRANAYSTNNIRDNINISEEHRNVMTRILLLEEENQKLKSDNKKLISRCRLIQNIKNVPENDIIEPINEIEYDNVTKNMKKIYT